ncbi:MAG: DUF4404 family protein [Gammaproteobacteria bacterium]
MSTEKLHQDLERLRRELAGLAPQDEAVRLRIERLIAEIESNLEAADPHRRRSLKEAATEAVEHFEASHPRATAILNDIMVTLSNLGI